MCLLCGGRACGGCDGDAGARRRPVRAATPRASELLRRHRTVLSGPIILVVIAPFRLVSLDKKLRVVFFVVVVEVKCS